jgi:N-acetylneuraminate synthase
MKQAPDAAWDRMIIAEIGSVHDGSFGNAGKLIEAAAAAGAGAVKFQTHIAAAETLRDAPMPPYFKGEPRFEYFQRTAFNLAQWQALAERAAACGVVFLSSPFSLEAVELLEAVGIGAYKIPSGEVSNLPLLRRIAGTGKPVLLSSGMSDWQELDAAVAAVRDHCPVLVMQCSSLYPCPPERVGLNVLDEMARRYGLPVGFSDHTMGCAAAFAAAARGARVIEKHFAFSRLMYGSDAPHSMEPAEFAGFCQGLREIWTMLEHPVGKADASAYAGMKRIFEKSVVTAVAVAAGTRLEERHLAYKKPGDGIPAARAEAVLGRLAARDLPADHQLAWSDLA